MRLLLTGGTGFVGTALFQKAAAAGHTVAGLIRPGSPVPAGLEPLYGTLAEPPWAAIERFQPDVLVHCAWISTPGVYLDSPENENHAVWGRSLVNGLFSRGLRRFVVLGTCIEYGMGGGRLDEASSPVAPSTPYARSKDQLRRWIGGDLACTDAALGWARVFYPYGTGEHPARLCSSLIRKLRQGEEVFLKTPHSTKDYIHIDDLADAILRVAEAGFHGPINLGTGDGVEVKAIADKIAEILGRPDLIRVPEAPQKDPLDFVVADAGRIRGLGWRPKVGLESGLRRLIEHSAT
jgi:dTDP-6-deoxy-L-talose 4-dehydrogenase (NAD+)